MQKQQPEMFFAGGSFLINFSKKEVVTHMFSCEFCEIFKNSLLTEHLRATASGNGGSVETSTILKNNALWPVP